MAMSKKTSADFSIKGANFAGSLKPDKVRSHKTYKSAVGITPAGTSNLVSINSKIPVDNSGSTPAQNPDGVM